MILLIFYLDKMKYIVVNFLDWNGGKEYLNVELMVGLVILKYFYF